MWLSPNALELQDSKLLCDEGRGFACLVRQGTSPAAFPRVPRLPDVPGSATAPSASSC